LGFSLSLVNTATDFAIGPAKLSVLILTLTLPTSPGAMVLS
jgi:hypothetical protein